MDLSFNQLSDVGIETFAELLGRCRDLESVNLQGNDIGSAGAEKLSQRLKDSVGLKYLNLSNNRVLTEGVVVGVCRRRASRRACC